MLDRKTPPRFQTQFEIKLEPLASGQKAKLNCLINRSIDVFRLEIVFPIGLLHAPSYAAGISLANLMALGTETRNAEEIAEQFENLGGYISITVDNRRTTFTLHGLTQNFENYLPILFDIIFGASFPEKEITLQKSQMLQRLSINKQKAAYLSGAAFKEVIYGNESYLGKSLNETDIATLNQETLSSFHQKFLAIKYFDIYLCGNISEQQLAHLSDFISQFEESRPLEESLKFPPVFESQNKTLKRKEGVQSSLIIGKRLFSRNHSDFHKFLVTNTIFGGYFGSRLMANIREEKGLTYGISSSLRAAEPDGVFSIKAEFKKEKVDEVLSEINKEITKLQTELVGLEELDKVKAYISGNILSSNNTIFDIMDKHKAIQNENLPSDFYETLSKNIAAVKAEDVLEIANKYLNGMSTIIAE